MLLWFPAVLAVLLIVAVAMGISGSSTSAFGQVFGPAQDPDLIAGEPLLVRSDEWLTFGSWLVSQDAQGYPRTNEVFPGGMDTSVFLDLPSWEWATIFRPSAFGFLLFGLDHGIAFRWWLSAFAVLCAGYLLSISVLPRRPVTSAAIAIAFFCCPLLQWWYVPSTLLPAALGLFAIAAVISSLRDERRWVRICWAAITSYLAIAAVMTFYPPYIIPAVLVAAGVSAGAFAMSAGHLGVRRATGRLVPLLIGAVGAAGVLGLFLATRWATIAAFMDTVYPGSRIQKMGAAGFDGLLRLFSAPFAQGLQVQSYRGFLGTNSSEASTPLMLGIFLLIPLAWLLVHDWRTGRRQWLMISCIACAVVLFAFLVLPGWDPIAHLLLLDRTIVPRSRMGFAVLGVMMIVLLLQRLDDGDLRLPPWVWLSTAGAAAASIGLVWGTLSSTDDPVLTGSAGQVIVAALFIAGVVLFCLGRALPGSLVLLIISLLVGIAVNPLYRGIVDLRETAMGREVIRIDDARPGSWLGIGTFQLSSVLVESGVRAYNGVQLYPVKAMWEDVDPAGANQDAWNRYASILWVPGTGEPQLSNLQPDVVAATFDSCSEFAQRHVTYVLTDLPVDQLCLREIQTATQGPATYWFYHVAAGPS